MIRYLFYKKNVKTKWKIKVINNEKMLHRIWQGFLDKFYMTVEVTRRTT